MLSIFRRINKGANAKIDFEEFIIFLCHTDMKSSKILKLYPRIIPSPLDRQKRPLVKPIVKTIEADRRSKTGYLKNLSPLSKRSLNKEIQDAHKREVSSQRQARISHSRSISKKPVDKTPSKQSLLKVSSQNMDGTGSVVKRHRNMNELKEIFSPPRETKTEPKNVRFSPETRLSSKEEKIKTSAKNVVTKPEAAEPRFSHTASESRVRTEVPKVSPRKEEVSRRLDYQGQETTGTVNSRKERSPGFASRDLHEFESLNSVGGERAKKIDKVTLIPRNMDSETDVARRIELNVRSGTKGDRESDYKGRDFNQTTSSLKYSPFLDERDTIKGASETEVHPHWPRDDLHTSENPAGRRIYTRHLETVGDQSNVNATKSPFKESYDEGSRRERYNRIEENKGLHEYGSRSRSFESRNRNRASPELGTRGLAKTNQDWPETERELDEKELSFSEKKGNTHEDTPKFEDQGKSFLTSVKPNDIKYFGHLLKKIIVFYERTEELKNEIFKDQNFNMMDQFGSFDFESKGYLTFYEFSQLFQSFGIIIDEPDFIKFLRLALKKQFITTDSRFYSQDLAKCFSPINTEGMLLVVHSSNTNSNIGPITVSTKVQRKLEEIIQLQIRMQQDIRREIQKTNYLARKSLFKYISAKKNQEISWNDLVAFMKEVGVKVFEQDLIFVFREFNVQRPRIIEENEFMTFFKLYHD
jgi:hypothetical protein